jgi:ribosomal protein L11 methyltransferase
MKQQPSLYQLSVVTSPEAEDAVTELLSGLFQQPVSSYTHLDTARTTVAVFFDEKPGWSRADQGRLHAALREIADCGLDLGPAQVRLRATRREDWAESWKRHFRPIAVGNALLVKPSWSRRQPRKGQAVVVLDPGLSFGTGQHPTTSFCLQQLVARRDAGTDQSLLDLGTGSGILAIAAARLGYRPVDALDFDTESVRVARANARQNRVARQLRLAQADVTRLPRRPARRYSVVCANLMANLLLAERDRIIARVAPEGWLLLAGILKVEFARVEAAYRAAGLRLVASRAEGEWRSGAFRLGR